MRSISLLLLVMLSLPVYADLQLSGFTSIAENFSAQKLSIYWN